MSAVATHADHALTLQRLGFASQRQGAAHERYVKATAARPTVQRSLKISTGASSGAARIVAAGSLDEMTSSAWNANAPKLASAQTTVVSRKSTARSLQSPPAAASHTKVRQQCQSDLREAEQDSKRIQMEQHLDSFLIRQAKLKGITTERVFLALESFGIETANDVDTLKTTKVPNIEPVLRDRLLDWKNTVASKFVLKQALPESERNRIAIRYAPVFLPLIQSVQTSIRDLQSFGESQRMRGRERIKAIEAAVQTAANVAANLDALNRLV